MAVEFPTTPHNTVLSGDVLTNVSLNYQWRRFVTLAVQNELRRQFATNDDGTIPDDLESWLDALITDFYTEEIVDGTAVGVIVYSFRAVIPFKWLLCDGETYPATAYPVLWDALPEDMKTETEFTLPDLRGKFLYGTGVSAEIGDTGGESEHTLTETEMPAHLHVTPAHAHTIFTSDGTGGRQDRVARGNTNTVLTQVTDTEPATNTGNTGGGAAHNNMPPYIKALPIIKALP